MAHLAAFNTMTAIKKKMHNMKEHRESAFDRADQLEQKLIEHKAISEKVRLHWLIDTTDGFNGAKGSMPLPQLDPEQVPGEALWRP